jgi:hypothetical protein
MLKALGLITLLIFIGMIIVAIPKTALSPTTATAPGETPHDAPPPKLSQVTIQKWNWNKGGFGSVMLATFVLKNSNQVEIKDIEVTCEHSGNSGTRIDSNKRTIYETVKPNSTRTISNFSMGFIHSQATKSSCSVTDYEYVNKMFDGFGTARR